MPTVSTQQTVQVTLTPLVMKKLRLKLKTFEALRDSINAAKAAQEKIKGEVESLFTDADEYEALIAGCRVDDYPLKIVAGTQKKLDRKYLISQGWVSQAQLNEATKEVPKKAFLKITCPGDRDEAQGEE